MRKQDISPHHLLKANIMPEPTFLDKFAFGVFQFSNRYQLLAEKDKIIVSVSGGIDSVCLLVLLDAFRLKIEFDLHVVHFHHGLRAESDEEAVFVSRLAEERKIPITIKRTESLYGKKGMQQKARFWRYEQLQLLKEEFGCNKIALGHHLDDLVETQIWRMIRGGSLFSFNPIQVKNLPYIRPLLNTPKRDLKNYLSEKNQKWVEDGSNESNDYTRNLIRNVILPEMDRCAGGKLSEKLSGLNSDAIYLKQLFDDQIPAESYKTDHLNYQTITDLNPLLSQELIHRFLLHHDQNEITRATIGKIQQMVASGKGNWNIALKDGAVVRGYNKRIVLVKKGNH